MTWLTPSHTLATVPVFASQCGKRQLLTSHVPPGCLSRWSAPLPKGQQALDQQYRSARPEAGKSGKKTLNSQVLGLRGEGAGKEGWAWGREEVQHHLNPMQTLSNLNRPAVISDSPGRTEYHSNPYESCFAVVPKHRKYRVYTNQNNCTSTTGLLLNRDSQLELLLTECFENRSFTWIST